MTALLLGILGGSGGSVIVGLIAWLTNRALTRAKTDDTSASAQERRANARKTDAEAWGLLQGNLTDMVATVSSLQSQVGDLQDILRDAAAYVVDVQRWDINGRTGPLPTAPDLTHD